MRYLLLGLIGIFGFANGSQAQFGDLLPKTKSKASSFKDVASVEVEVEPPEAKPGQEVTVKVTIKPKTGCYTYPANTDQISRNSFNLPTSGDLIFVEPVEDPPGATEKRDPDTGDVEKVYKSDATWKLKAIVSPDAEPGKKSVRLTGTRLQACNDTNCFNLNPSPEVEFTVEDADPVDVPEKYQQIVAGKKEEPKDKPATTPATQVSSELSPGHAGLLKKPYQPIEEYQETLDQIAERLKGSESTLGTIAGSGFRGLFLAAVFWGLISLVTPCVFPMIPITVSLFLKQSNQSTTKTFKLAAIYTLTIIVVIGGSAVFLLSLFRGLSVNPYMNIFLGLLFIFFALSLFGMYDITLPGFMLRYTEKRRGAGGVIGTVFGALAFSIVSFTCVAPFLGGFAGMASSGNYSQTELMLAGITFATAFATPFFLLALFPSLLRKLPKSGGWLETVKVVMGFLELAAAFKFFRTAEIRLIQPAEYFTYDFVIAAWIAISIAAGLYLLNLYRLPMDDEESHISVGRLLTAMIFLGMAAYLTPAMFKTAGPGSPNQRPQGVLYAWIDAFILPDPTDELPWSADLPGALDRVRQDKATGSSGKRFVFIDFTGVTCTNCRYNENNVFVKPRISELLQQYELVQLYTDDVPAIFYSDPPALEDLQAEALANLQFQKSVFGTEQLPLYVILEPLVGGGVRLVGIYDEGKINSPDRFIRFLSEPLNRD